MHPIEKTIKGGRRLVIREADGKDAGPVLAYIDVISRETDFLTFGPGEFTLTEQEETDHLEKCKSKENALYLLALLEGAVVGMEQTV